jgi:predicted lipid-binding transport protein (Tim44 family)
MIMLKLMGFILIVLTVFSTMTVVAPEFSGEANARSNSNWTARDRSNYCSARAERHANRYARRNTAAGAATGAAVGAIASQSRRNTGRNAGRGALIGGGAGLVSANSRWTTYYNRYYRNCVRW